MTATEIAFAMIGVMQGVLALVWLLGCWVAGDMRRAAAHWAAYAALSAVSFALLTMALTAQPPLRAESIRALGNLSGIVAFIALQRGIWLFIGYPVRLRAHALALLVALVAAFVGLSPSGSAFRVSANSAVLTLLALSMARDLNRHARDALRLRWPWAMALPLLAAAAGFAFRGIRAAIWPHTVLLQMTVDSGLNVASAISYMIIALAFHAVLMALVVGRLMADLRHRSRHDGLTGLLNRRAIEEALQAQIQRCLRASRNFSVLMLDLDHFKVINDEHGHAVGDRALKHAAAALKTGLREVDNLARYGGEEFLAMLPDATVETSRGVAERLRTCLDEYPLLLPTTRIALTASIGIAQWSGAGEDTSQLVARADAALYQAKLQGRDRVVAAAPGHEPLRDGRQSEPR